MRRENMSVALDVNVGKGTSEHSHMSECSRDSSIVSEDDDRIVESNASLWVVFLTMTID